MTLSEMVFLAEILPENGLREAHGEAARRALERLWTDVFGDSCDYVNLVADGWLEEATSIVLTDGKGEPAAIMLGHGWNFAKGGCGAGRDPETGRDTLRGLYLSGLATRPDLRRRGIMGAMIEEMKRRARRLGFDFLFLVPASATLRDYYRREAGFVTRSWRRYLDLVNTGAGNDLSGYVADFVTLDGSATALESLARELTGIMGCDSVNMMGERGCLLEICHTVNDVRMALSEAGISHGRLVVTRLPDAQWSSENRSGNRKPEDGRKGSGIHGFMLAEPSAEEEERVNIIAFQAADKEESEVLINKLAEIYPNKLLRIFLSLKQSIQINKYTNLSAYEEPYGMIFPLREGAKEIEVELSLLLD